ncbi:hypothetical protein M8J76_003288 [Diaphorina citri]|nr:hypothetical protein M8J76_003288 [Diaphorina citri]
MHQAKLATHQLTPSNLLPLQSGHAAEEQIARPDGAHIPDDPLSFVVFLAYFFVFGFLVERRLSDIFGCSVSDALAATSSVPSPATSPIPSSPPHPNPPAVHFELVPDVELTPRGPRISITFEDPDAVPFMSDTDSDSDSDVPNAPAAEQQHQDRREATSDSDSEDWSGVRPVAPRFLLSLPHGDSIEQTGQRTVDTVAAVIGWVASNVDFIPPTYPRRRPRRLPRGRPKRYKKRAQEP